jgi:hypothetical protein
LAYLGEIGDHLLALRVVVEQGTQGGGYVFGGEAVLKELGDDTAAGDEVDHGDGQVAVGVEGSRDLWRVVNEAFCQPEGERGDLIDDDKGVADNGSLDRGGSAGDYAGAGVMEGFAGVGDQVHWRAYAASCARRSKLLDPFTFEGGGDGDYVLVTSAESSGRVEHGREI